MVHTVKSERIFLLIALAVLVISAVQTYLLFDGTQQADWYAKVQSVLISSASSFYIVAGLGISGIFLARKAGLTELYDETVSWSVRFVYPILAGILLSLGFVIFEQLYHQDSLLQHLWQPQIQVSILISFTTVILEEVFFRLFLISAITWFLYHVIFRKKYLKISFFIATIISTTAFSLLHVPNFLALSAIDITAIQQQQLLYDVIAMSMLQSFAAAYFLYRSGFLSVLLVHFCMDVVWSVVYTYFL